LRRLRTEFFKPADRTDDTTIYMIPGSRGSVSATSIRVAPMSPGKKVGAATALLAIGLLAAIVFRKPAGPVDGVDGSANASGAITRRLDDQELAAARPPAPFRLAVDSDPFFRPPLAAAGLAPVDVATLPHSIERSVSPVGALLQPLESASASSANPIIAPDLQPVELRLPADVNGGESVPRTHRVADGDTLSKLAAEYLGSGERYLEIFAANRETLKTPDLLPIGVTLKIPPRGTGSAVEMPAASLAPIPADAWRPAR